MTTGPEHYREAQNRLLMAWEEGRDAESVTHLVAEAQVHATLALAAATAAGISHEDVDPATWQGWRDAIDDRTDHPLAAAQRTSAWEHLGGDYHQRSDGGQMWALHRSAPPARPGWHLWWGPGERGVWVGDDLSRAKGTADAVIAVLVAAESGGAA